MPNSAASDIESPGSAPTTAMMSAWDVLSWIAFKEVRPRPDSDEAIDFTYRWSDSDAGPVLEALEARASVEPYCTVQPLILDGRPWDGNSYVHRAFSPVSPKMLRWIRAKARQREARLVTYSELAATLRAELETLADENRRIGEAQHALMEELRASRLTAWAKRDIRRGEVNPAAVHEAVPFSIFMDELVVVTEWGTIGPDPEHPTAIFRYHGPQFRDVRFATADVLAIWPPPTVILPEPAREQIPVVSRDRQSRGGLPPKHDWDSFWIEVALYAAENDLDPEHRTELQRHMQKWTAER